MHDIQAGDYMKIEQHEIPVREVAEAFALEAMQADHITPWSKGGRTVSENCQMLCADCNCRKGDR